MDALHSERLSVSLWFRLWSDLSSHRKKTEGEVLPRQIMWWQVACRLLEKHSLLFCVVCYMFGEVRCGIFRNKEK